MDISSISVNTQSSIRIVSEGKKVLYFDPLDIAAESHDADYIFLTHDHYDHYSVKDIEKIRKDSTRYIIPLPMEKQLVKNNTGGEVMAVEQGKRYETEDFSFETVPSYNKLKPFHPKKAGWVGYIADIDGVKVYVAGDTDVTREAASVKCDIAVIPIGGTYTMNYKEAAKLINEMKPKAVIPTHYGSYVGKESDGEDFKKLVDKDIDVRLLL